MKPLNSGHLRVLLLSTPTGVVNRQNICLLLRGVRYWGGSLTKIAAFRNNILPTIQGMPAIWDVRYWEVSLCLHQPDLLVKYQTK